MLTLCWESTMLQNWSFIQQKQKIWIGETRLKFPSTHPWNKSLSFGGNDKSSLDTYIHIRERREGKWSKMGNISGRSDKLEAHGLAFLVCKIECQPRSRANWEATVHSAQRYKAILESQIYREGGLFIAKITVTDVYKRAARMIHRW